MTGTKFTEEEKAKNLFWSEKKITFVILCSVGMSILASQFAC
jgi:hypothetical protein